MATNVVNPILFIHQGHELYGSDKVLLLNIKAYKVKYPDEIIHVIIPNTGSLSGLLQSMPGVEVQIRGIGVLRKYDLKRMKFMPLLRILCFFRLIPLIKQYKTIFINSTVIIDFIIAARFFNTPTYIHVHELPTGMAKPIFRHLLSHSRAELIFISEAVKQSFGKLKNLKQHVIWNGTRPVPEIQDAMPKEPNFNLLLIGRINHWKGQPLLVEAVALLAETDKSRVQVTILGDVYGQQYHLKHQLNELIVKHHLQNNIQIIPFTPTPELHYHRADVVIVPSLLPEPFGLVAIEAMSAGKPVIAANHGGLTEIVVHNETGLLFEPGNPRALAEAITFVIQNPRKMQQMGAAGKKRYQEYFTEEIYIRNFQEIV
jgi:glycosyltransferase involved in cell wall biosynthesis